jgi:hypothetical protein
MKGGSNYNEQTASTRSIALQPCEHPPIPDRAPHDLAAGTPQWLRDELVALVGTHQVLLRAIELIRYVGGAGPYRMYAKLTSVFSNNRVCEVEMRLAALKNYRSVILLLKEMTRAEARGCSPGEQLA